jgi:hypothetical protein
MNHRLSISTLFCIFLTTSPATAQWRSEVILETEQGMGGVAIGDLDPSSPGNEAFVVNGAGEAWMAKRTGATWKAERIYRGPGELIMCAVGDVDPTKPGNEFVGCGSVEGPESLTGPGHAVLVWREDGRWESRQIFRDTLFLHGVAIGDVSTKYPGNEVITVGFNHRVQMSHFDRESNAWRHETIYVANDRLKVCVVDDVMPDRPGMEIIATGADGKPQLLWEGKLGWHHETVFVDRAGQSRVTVGPLGVLLAGDDGKVNLATRGDGRWLADCLGRDTAKMRGVVLADLDPRYDGVEAYACGYSGKVTQFVRVANSYWQANVLLTDPRALHHLVAGEFDPEHSGPEMLTAGHSGKLYVLSADN